MVPATPAVADDLPGWVVSENGTSTGEIVNGIILIRSTLKTVGEIRSQLTVWAAKAKIKSVNPPLDAIGAVKISTFFTDASDPHTRKFLSQIL